ncbi:MAG: BlaI/MecI/CopY family transcriptional regulator [Prevotella sp.]|nr:BlaI/MecI/CopY family transcriptional regulator [Prevotella sp.]
MKRDNEERHLTKSEMDIMNILWDRGRGMTTHEIIERYPEPQPAYSTIATFLKILTTKGFIQSAKLAGGGKTFVFTPLISREAYTNRVMKDVKTTFFAGSLKSMLSFFAQQEEVSDEDLQEIISLIKK